MIPVKKIQVSEDNYTDPVEQQDTNATSFSAIK